MDVHVVAVVIAIKMTIESLHVMVDIVANTTRRTPLVMVVDATNWEVHNRHVTEVLASTIANLNGILSRRML
jgi:hypothetical protein